MEGLVVFFVILLLFIALIIGLFSDPQTDSNTSSNNNNTLGGNYSHSFDNTEILQDKYRQLERNEKAMDYIRQVESNMASTQREIDKTDRILNSYPKL